MVDLFYSNKEPSISYVIQHLFPKFDFKSMIFYLQSIISIDKIFFLNDFFAS